LKPVSIRGLWSLSERLIEQEAQLSQRDSAMLRAIKYFTKSLKVIRNDILE